MFTKTDYKVVSKAVTLAVGKECAASNTAPEVVLKMSLHPDDDYLYVVIAKRLNPPLPSAPYVVWAYNHQSRGLAYGVYDIDFRTALGVMASKMK